MSETPPKYPPHHELYRDFHKIQRKLGNLLLQFLDDNFEGEQFDPQFELDFEENYWDIIYTFHTLSNDTTFYFLIEYKSSINEWGKHFDEFLRQTKNRIKKYSRQYPLAKPIILSFDENFEQYSRACRTNGIEVLVLDNYWLTMLRLPENPLDAEEIEETQKQETGKERQRRLEKESAARAKEMDEWERRHNDPAYQIVDAETGEPIKKRKKEDDSRLTWDEPAPEKDNKTEKNNKKEKRWFGQYVDKKPGT